MANTSDLREIEEALGFKFPLAFYEKWDEFVAFSKTSAFQSQFPNTSLVNTISEIQACYAIEDGLRGWLVPFMFERQPKHIDYYGFDITRPVPEFPVGVFAQHTIVHDWPGFDSFFTWAQQHCRTNRA